MTWKAFHNRGEALNDVIATAAVRMDGILPMDLPGVAETFRDELDLLAALHLKWHTRLDGNVERQLMNQPLDLQEQVAIAWKRTADGLPGIRVILDHYRGHPIDEAMAEAVAKATAKEHQYLAVMAGRSGLDSTLSERIGAEIEAAGRELHTGVATIATPQGETAEAAGEAEEAEPRGSLIERLRAVIAA